MKYKAFKMAVRLSLVASMVLGLAAPALANDSWPFIDAPIGQNEPNQSGYHANDVFRWCPDSDPHAPYLRSRVPRQERIEAFAPTQANPDLPPQVQVFNLAGDYGNAFFDNSPYTNKFARYHFNFWGYTDYWGQWHGSTTANAQLNSRHHWDDQAMADWESLWFEFGVIRMPDPTWADAARKNGNLVLGDWFTSNNDRGQQSHANFLVRDADGNFPAALQMIAMAEYFGFDGYFFNQEEISPNLQVADIPTYMEFCRTFVEAGLYVFQYDSINTATGANTFNRQLGPDSRRMLWNNNQKISHSFFIDYTASPNLTNIRNNFEALLNENPAAREEGLTLYDVYFRGLEVGSTGVDGAHWANTLTQRMNAISTGGIPQTSFAMLGTDIVHADLDRNMGNANHSNADFGQALAGNFKHRTDYQWMTTVREQLQWTSPRRNPLDNSSTPAGFSSDVYAPGTSFPNGVNNFGGFSQFYPEKSVVGGNIFVTNFNVGRGMRYYDSGNVAGDREWSNMSMQDISPTWQWWIDTDGTRLFLDFDYGAGVKVDPNPARQAYNEYNAVGGYMGGNSLVINGRLDADNFIRLYKTDLKVNSNTIIELTYLKSSASDDSLLNIGLLFKDDPATLVRVPVENSDPRSSGWQKATIDLSEFAGRDIAVLGFAVDAGEEAIDDYRINIGQLRFTDGSVPAPAAPTGLKITHTFPDSGEMYIGWDFPDCADIPAHYEKIVMYKVYVNDQWVGGRYDEVFYIKDLPATSGTIGLVAVSADGVESAKTTVAFNLDTAVSDIAYESKVNGDLVVTWDETGVSGSNVEVSVGQIYVPVADRFAKSVSVPVGTGSATLTGLPTDGEHFRVSIRVGGGLPMSLTGRLVDVDAQPYNAFNRPLFPSQGASSWIGHDVTVSQGGETSVTIRLPEPDIPDWRFMHVFETSVDGTMTSRQFNLARWGSNTAWPHIVRGRSHRTSQHPFTFNPQNISTISVVVEDYSGNRAAPVYVWGLEPQLGERHFPDPAMLEYVRGLVGDADGKIMESAVMTFSGTLTIPSAVNDFRGLNRFQNARALVIDNNDAPQAAFTALFANTGAAAGNLTRYLHLPPMIRELSITNCPNFTSIHAAATGTVAANAHNAIPRSLRRSATQSNGYVGGYRGSSMYLEKIDFSGSGLTSIPANLFAFTDVREIGLKNMRSLTAITLNDSNLERLTWDDATVEGLTTVNLAGSRFDLSANTQEGGFIAAVRAVGIDPVINSQRTRVDAGGLAAMRDVELTYVESFDFDPRADLALMGDAFVSGNSYGDLANESWFRGVHVRVRQDGSTANPNTLIGLAGRPGYFAVEYMRSGQAVANSNFFIEMQKIVNITSPSEELVRFLHIADTVLYSEESYTEESWAAYQEAIAAARAIVLPLPERDVWAKAWDELTAAYEGLKVVTPPAEFDGTSAAQLTALLWQGDVMLKTPGSGGYGISAGNTLTVPEGSTLYVSTILNVRRDATLLIEGTVVVLEGGRINNDGGSAGGGKIVIAEGGNLVNYGRVESVTNSTIINNGTITNNGTTGDGGRFEVRDRATFINNGTVSGTRELSIHRNAIVESDLPGEPGSTPPEENAATEEQAAAAGDSIPEDSGT